jgi:hypothetical protein
MRLRTALVLISACVVACQKQEKLDASHSIPEAKMGTFDSAPDPSFDISSQVDVAGMHVVAGSIATHLAQPALPSQLWGFTDIGLDSSRTRLKIVLTKAGAPLAQLLPEGALAVVNGGYFEPNFRPSGWLKDAGLELTPKGDTSKGGVFALGAPGIYVGPFAELGFEPELAVQSFPLIVEQGGKSGIHSDDGRRAARTVVCMVGGKLHFIVVAAPRGEGPTLFESAALMRDSAPRGFGCSVALNLDGGPSSGVRFAPQVATRQRTPFANVAYGIAILPR